MIQKVSSIVYTKRRQMNGIILVMRALCSILVITGCGNPRGCPFSVSTKHRTNIRMNAATRCLSRGRHASSRLSYTRLVWWSNGVNSGPTLLLKLSCPLTLMSLAREPNRLLVSDIFHFTKEHKSAKHELKARSDVLGSPLTYIPRSAQCLMVYLRRGEGVPPPLPFPKHDGVSLTLVPSPPGGPFGFSIKNHRPILFFTPKPASSQASNTHG